MPAAPARQATPAAPASRRGVPRLESRLPAILDATACLFRQKGYTVTSMRDIAAASGMLAGSLYYHFESKDELLVAVYAEGVRRISASVRAALDRKLPPWTRLEAVCAAHLAALLEDSDYAQVVIRVRPDDAPGAADRLVALRDDYERLFAEALEQLPLAPRTDRRALRLMLLGALNWSQTWYRSGHDAPEVIARQFVGLLRRQLEP
jgi:AcrR family transcriptional regulator